MELVKISDCTVPAAEIRNDAEIEINSYVNLIIFVAAIVSDITII